MYFCFLRHFVVLHFQVSGSCQFLDKAKNCSKRNASHEYSKGTTHFKKQEKMGKNFFSQE